MEDLIIKRLSFTDRPIPIPAEYRPLYKIALIVLVLKLCCRSETSSLLKLHLFSWALSSDGNLEKLNEHVKSSFTSEFSVWGIEPALNRALQFAIAEQICEVISGKNYKLSPKGVKFYDLIQADPDLLSNEKRFLSSIGKNTITDSRITSMSKQWTLPYA